MKSVGILPLENLPVAFPPAKSRPYGKKLLLAMVGMKLLFPASTDESPKTMTAGTFASVIVFGDDERWKGTIMVRKHKNTLYAAIINFDFG